MTLAKTAQKLAKNHLPAPLARAVKRVGVYPRYASQRRACRAGFVQHGGRYPQKILFVAGLPKSGTTWLENMLADFPGFSDLLIPDVAAHELRTGGSHDYELPDDTFRRFDGMLVLTKMHVHGSTHNAALLRDAGLRYAVLYRDLRDVALSYFFYVRQTPWHPEFPAYRGLELERGLERFADTLLPAYIDWVRSWRANRDPELSLELRYEEMLADPRGALARTAEHFRLGATPEELDTIVERHSFRRVADGRTQGQQSDSSFFRKGIAGDWKNQFTPRLVDIYEERMHDFLEETGYERTRTTGEPAAR
jgi:hypothetical protein